MSVGVSLLLAKQDIQLEITFMNDVEVLFLEKLLGLLLLAIVCYLLGYSFASFLIYMGTALGY